MYPILFEIGGLEVRAWGVMVALGIISGTWLSMRLARKQGIKEDLILDFILFGTVVGILGARIWEVIFSWSNFVSDPLSALKFWSGGLSIQGAVTAGLLYTIWFVRKHKINFWSFIDIAAPGLILGQALGRIGCFLNGDAYGIPATNWFGVVYSPGTPAFIKYGAIPLVPAELMESAGSFLIMGILLLLFVRFRPFNGFIALMYFALYSVLRFTLEFWRGDSLMVTSVLKAAQVSSIIIALAAVLIIVFRWAQTNREMGKKGIAK